jgi:hypothetical protein
MTPPSGGQTAGVMNNIDPPFTGGDIDGGLDFRISD